MTSNKLPKLLILAGGKSSRMGSDKSQMAWHGKSQELHLAELGRALRLEVYISKAHDFDGEDSNGFPVIKDRYADKGPLGAICSAFEYDNKAAWLVLACDMPFVNEELISMLIEKRNSLKQATALSGSDGQPQPLLCIYEPALCEQLLSALKRNLLSPRRLLKKADICLLEIAHSLHHKNINTPSERPKAIAVIGAGAAGMFFVNQLLDRNPENCLVHVFELGNKPLAKVKISGGGRCNVTHACFDPAELVKFYPRGEKELRSGFSRFCTGDVMEWFDNKGVSLKIEEDNRVFPVTDSSQTIIDCLMKAEDDPRVNVHFRTKVEGLRQKADAGSMWEVATSKGVFNVDYVLVATGGTKAAWNMMEAVGLPIVPPVPSLFSFDMRNFPWKDLAGLSVQEAELSIAFDRDDLNIKGSPFLARGPLLVTHRGFSGPAILALSSRAARELHAVDYRFILKINFFSEIKAADLESILKKYRQDFAKQKVYNKAYGKLPSRLWKRLVEESEIGDRRWADVSNTMIEKLLEKMLVCAFSIDSKSTHKEEFVTAGGIELKAINFKSMEAKDFPGLFFAGEVLNIDAVTGGFNFQAAWTSAWVAAQHIADSLLAEG